jgi:tRNA(adenine34) deaminase
MTSCNDEYYMRRALALAGHAAKLGEVPVGALVVIDEKIVAEGWNQPVGTHDPTAHAEIIAMRGAAKAVANYRLVNSTLYVTVEPCSMCAGALIHARIGRLVYGCTEPKSGVVESNGCLLAAEYVNHHVDFQGGVLADQCSSIMSDFFKMRRLAKKTTHHGLS